MERKYYEAYDDRYRQVHDASVRWFAESPSPIVYDVLREFGIQKTDKILEIGCGEGRDARFLLEKGYDLLATDISAEAVAFCRKELPEFEDRFQILDCLKDTYPEKFDCIYAVAVVHMLVLDEDRGMFYRFLEHHLKDSGIALICSMGDGVSPQQSDVSAAFCLQERLHEPTGKILKIAGTSYRAVSFTEFEKEILENGLEILKQGITLVEPDYGKMMYAVVKKAGL